jgi:hypothetical protein
MQLYFMELLMLMRTILNIERSLSFFGVEDKLEWREVLAGQEPTGSADRKFPRQGRETKPYGMASAGVGTGQEG